jgi:long-chain fatty acid transport protein
MYKPIKTITSLAIMGLFGHQVAHAGAFSLYTESSAAMLGNFAAGAAAEATDASIGWYNPAGLVRIREQEVVLSGTGVFPSAKLSGTSTFTTALTPNPSAFYRQTFANLQGAENAVVPAFHYAIPLGERVTAGLSVVVPFGLSTNWGQHSAVRYQATLTDLKTINLSPELGGRLNEHFSIGAGLDLQWAQVKFNQMAGSPALLALGKVDPTLDDSLSFNKGKSFSTGFHAGILGMFNDEHTRIGLNYQSQVKHQFHGNSILSGRLADAPLFADTDATFVSDNLFSNTVGLPDITTLSLYQDINPTFAVLGSLVYAGWESFKVIKLYQVAGLNDESLENALINSYSPNFYKNAWRFALGTNVHVTDEWMLRLGGGYDQTPTINAQRDIRLPDANRWALSIGGHYQMRPSLGFDLGYSYLWADEASFVNKTNFLGASSNFNVNARANNHVHLFGLQAVWKIDHDVARSK